MLDCRSEYALQTLLYVVRLASSGDYKTPARFGVTERQLHELLTLSTHELHELAMMSQANYVKIQFDSNALDIALEHNTRKSKHRALIEQMLMAEASFPCMLHLFGLSSDDVANFKKLLDVPSRVGRPARCSEDEEAKLWPILKSADAMNTEQLPELLLKAHRETGIAIGRIWVLLQQWWSDIESDGEIMREKVG